MALTDELAALALEGARTVVAAAATDAWGIVKQSFARLLGRGDPRRVELTSARLEQARGDLSAAAAPDLARVQMQVEAAWQTRLLDLLEDHPEMASDVQVLLSQLQAQPGIASAVVGGQHVVIGRDASITALGGGIAAGLIVGSAVSANPTSPGSAQ
jgi:hypothetical protein